MKLTHLTAGLCLLAFTLATGAKPPADAPEDEVTRILFIGNSYTAGWGDEEGGRAGAKAGGVPGMLQSMADARGLPVAVDRSVRGGTALHEHLEDGTRIADALDKAAWDIVVLQEHSTVSTRKGDGTHGTTEDFFAGVQRFEEAIHQRHPEAQIMLFQTWAREKNNGMYPKYIPSPAEMNADLRNNYAKAAGMIGAEVAPVGDAWARAIEKRPDFRLHTTDLHHARATGVYLSALVFYATLFEDDPRGLPTLAGISPADAAFLQEVAWEVVQPRLSKQDAGQPAEATK